MKNYLEKRLGSNGSLESDELPLNSKKDMLANLSAIAYAKDNGFEIEILDGYYEANDMILHRFRISKGE